MADGWTRYLKSHIFLYDFRVRLGGRKEYIGCTKSHILLHYRFYAWKEGRNILAIHDREIGKLQCKLELMQD